MTKLFCKTCSKPITGKQISTHKRHKHQIGVAPTPGAKLEKLGGKLLKQVGKRAKDVLTAKKAEAIADTLPRPVMPVSFIPFPPVLPCDCRSTFQLKNGLRICACSTLWQLKWVRKGALK